MPSARLKVKSLVIMRRIRWCSGSSIRANITGLSSSGPIGMMESGMVSALSRGSTSAALMSWYRLTTQVGWPCHNARCRPRTPASPRTRRGDAAGIGSRRGAGITGRSVSAAEPEVVEVIGVSH